MRNRPTKRLNSPNPLHRRLAAVALVLAAGAASAADGRGNAQPWAGIGLAAAAGVGATVMDPTAVRGGGTGLRVSAARLTPTSLTGSPRHGGGLGLKTGLRGRDAQPVRLLHAR